MVICRVDDRKFALLGHGEDGVSFGESGARGCGDKVG